MKKIVSILLAVVLCFTIAMPVFAAASEQAEPEATSEESVARAEETKWYYRVTEDGQRQKRQWSITYGYWKTDWIPY